jgi:hypothetical protein
MTIRRGLTAAALFGGVCLADDGLEPIAARAMIGDQAPAPAQVAPKAAPTPAAGSVIMSDAATAEVVERCFGGEARARFQSDHAFDRFVGPITNPIFSKDPRSNTEIRALFINNWMPSNHPLFRGGNYQVAAVQARIALTERLSIIADKDGYGFIHPGGQSPLANSDGWLNIAAGLKYVLIRDVENQFLLSAGFQYELNTGEGNVFQNHGDGVWTVFLTTGKEFNCDTHFVGTLGHSRATDPAENSSFLYANLHLDRRFGKLYPLIEMNWFHYTGDGNRGLPAAIGELDGHINLGTNGVVGNDFVTVAAGCKYKFSRHAETGVAWEVPISNRKDIMDNRLTWEFILRY